MKVIVFGLGNFGMSLAISLTETGNEVIGVDKDIEKVNLVKDKISHAIAMDSTNELSYEALPLKDADKVVVAIGENEGAAIITTAIIKKLSDVKIIEGVVAHGEDHFNHIAHIGIDFYHGGSEHFNGFGKGLLCEQGCECMEAKECGDEDFFHDLAQFSRSLGLNFQGAWLV